MVKLTVLERGLKMLTLFSDRESSLSIPEIAARSNLPESTAYRYVATLKSQGLVERDTNPGYYRLGLGILELAQRVKRRSIIPLCLPVMEELSHQTEETVLLCTTHGQKGICLEKVEGHHNLRVSFERGESFDLHAGATGKVLLAWLNENEQDSIVNSGPLPKFTENTIIDPKRLKAELRNIRRTGFSVSEGEVHQGVRAVAAPIFNGREKIIANLSVGGPAHRLKGLRKDETIRQVIDATRKITEQMSVYEN